MGTGPNKPELLLSRSMAIGISIPISWIPSSNHFYKPIHSHLPERRQAFFQRNYRANHLPIYQQTGSASILPSSSLSPFSLSMPRKDIFNSSSPQIIPLQYVQREREHKSPSRSLYQTEGEKRGRRGVENQRNCERDGSRWRKILI